MSLSGFVLFYTVLLVVDLYLMIKYARIGPTETWEVPDIAARHAPPGGVTVDPNGVGSLPKPSAAVVSLERNVAPILPTWAWAAIAAIALGTHWFVRRRGGLA